MSKWTNAPTTGASKWTNAPTTGGSKWTNAPSQAVGAAQPAQAVATRADYSVGRALDRTSHTTKVAVSVRCEQLDTHGSTFLVAYSRLPHEATWRFDGQSEIIENNTWPNYRQWSMPGGEPKESLQLDFSIASLREVRFEAYRVRKHSDDPHDFKRQAFLGCAKLLLAEAMFARGQGTGMEAGWLVKELENAKDPTAVPGYVAVMAQEEWAGKSLVSIDIAGKVRGSEFKLRMDPYYVIYRTEETSIERVLYLLPDLDEAAVKPNRMPVYRSEVCFRTTSPKWKKVELPVQALCQGKDNSPILLCVYNWARGVKHKVLGECIITLADIQKASRDAKTLQIQLNRCADQPGPDGSHTPHADTFARRMTSSSIPGKSVSRLDAAQHSATMANAGQLAINFKIRRKWSFFDYMRGGMELRLATGIELTRFNSAEQDPRALHNYQGEGPNDFTAVLRAVGAVFMNYAGREPKLYSYGFGAKIPPSHTICSDCFSLSGDCFAPEFDTFEAVVEAYHRSLHVVRLHGPSRLRDLIRHVAHLAREHSRPNPEQENFVPMKFWVLVIITSGTIADRHDTVDELTKVFDAPLHILIVGIGTQDFNFLHGLDDEVAQMQKPHTQIQTRDRKERKIVTFQSFEDYRDKPTYDFIRDLVANLQHAVVEYYTSMDITPWDVHKFEDGTGQDLPIPIIQMPAGGGRVARGERKRRQSKDHKKEDLPFGRQKRNVPDQVAKLPQFLKDLRTQLLEDALALDYAREDLLRAMKDGTPSPTLEVLLDNVINAGRGRSKGLRAALQSVDLEKGRRRRGSQSRLRAAASAAASAANATPSPPEDKPSLIPLPGVVDETFSHQYSNSTMASRARSGLVVVCSICHDFLVDTELLPCKHKLACHDCVEKMGLGQPGATCPLCRKEIAEIVYVE